jgi:hypothetical protein
MIPNFPETFVFVGIFGNWYFTMEKRMDLFFIEILRFFKANMDGR